MLQRVAAVITPVCNQFLDSTLADLPRSRLRLLQRLEDRAGIARIGRLHGDRQQCTAGQIHRMLGLVRQMRAPVLHLCDARIRIVPDGGGATEIIATEGTEVCGTGRAARAGPSGMRHRAGGPQLQAANPVKGRFGVVSGHVEPETVGVGILIQITPQLRILVAIDAIDGRKYAPSIDMRSSANRRARNFQIFFTVDGLTGTSNAA